MKYYIVTILNFCIFSLGVQECPILPSWCTSLIFPVTMNSRADGGKVWICLDPSLCIVTLLLMLGADILASLINVQYLIIKKSGKDLSCI